MPDVVTIQTTTSQATVDVTEVGEVQVVEVSVSESPGIIEIGVIGPQGPPGAVVLGDLDDVNVIGKVDKSVLVYDSSTDCFVASDANTITTITDGGNF